MATNEFERVVRAHRRRQLVWTRDSVQRLDGILRRAAIETAERLKHYAGDSVLTREYLAALLSDLNRILGDLAADFSGMLPRFLAGAAQISADREASLARAVLTDAALQAALRGLLPETRRSMQIRGVGNLSVEFGRVAEHAVNVTYQRVYKDGLTLSDRIWQLDQTVRRDIQDRVVQAVAQQKSARELAKDIRGYLRDTEGANARYNAMRLARTELSTAGREGHIQSAINPDGSLKSHISAIGWRLSASHVRPDVCDMWASQDLYSLGAGNYTPEGVPVDHPHGLCYTVSILKDRPDLQFVAKEPRVDEPAETVEPSPPAKPRELPFSPPRRWRARVDATQRAGIAQRAAAHRMTVPQYKSKVKNKLQGFASEGRLCKNIKARHFQAALADGRFKSQFETGTSDGLFDPSMRSFFEAEAMGIPDGIEPSARPVYGWVADRDSDELGASLQYGNITVVFRRERMLGRTSVTWDDSLNITGGAHLPAAMPQPVDRVDHRIASYSRGGDPLRTRDLKTLYKQGADALYMEAQYFGPVTLDDIQEVIISDDGTHNHLIPLMEHKGIAWRFRKPGS